MATQSQIDEIERDGADLTLFMGCQKYGEYKKADYKQAIRDMVQLARIDHPSLQVRLFSRVELTLEQQLKYPEAPKCRVFQNIYSFSHLDEVEKELREEMEECELEHNLNACGDDPHGN